jgi:HSP20 family molecular chaperone IbpA
MKERTADIFVDFERIQERMEHAWRHVLGPPGAPRFCPPVIEPAIDVYETEREVVVVVEMAGISEGDVDITVDAFRRELLLPAEVNPDGARVEYSRGMLEIVLPKVRRRTGRPVRIVVR